MKARAWGVIIIRHTYQLKMAKNKKSSGQLSWPDQLDSQNRLCTVQHYSFHLQCEINAFISSAKSVTKRVHR